MTRPLQSSSSPTVADAPRGPSPAVTDAPRGPSPAAFDAVIFDMDGVIFDTERIYFEAETILLARRGIEFSPIIARKLMGLPAIPAIELFKSEYGLPESATQLLAECQVIFRELLHGNLRFMPGFEEFFGRLEQRQIRRALATSTQRPLAEHMLGSFQLLERFEHVLTGCDVVNGKPHPDIYLKACDRLQIAPRNALVIEDSVNGAKSAKAAGCFCVVVLHELTRSIDFSFADLVADHLLDERLLDCVAV